MTLQARRRYYPSGFSTFEARTREFLTCDGFPTSLDRRSGSLSHRHTSPARPRCRKAHVRQRGRGGDRYGYLRGSPRRHL
ncbi:hypothetical protein M6B38_340945 [Iris pallida]|uniref:Uncharacterized protein n=1 Tax=Iris pallida TaxID=29817 RepID=A0AAX6GXA3_IRIPA|nr:hypothetical protein M6B38_340945 [Iris pallida]